MNSLQFNASAPTRELSPHGRDTKMPTTQKLKDMPKTKKFVYFLGGGNAEGHERIRELPGGKGAGLPE